MDRSNLSKIERQKIPYDQHLLERAAEVYRCEPADLLTRNPRDDAAWSIWDRLATGQRKQALRLLKALAEEADESDEKAA